MNKIWSGLKAPAQPSCRVPTFIVYLSNSSSVEIFHKLFFSKKSSHKLKTISGTIIIKVKAENGAWFYSKVTVSSYAIISV